MTYKNVNTLINANKNVDELVHYDFKHERGIYKSVGNIQLWLEYRNEVGNWDCDGSGDNATETCGLTRDIYKVLWEWSSENENRYKNTAYFNNMLMGPDTMNSYFNVLTQVVEVVSPNGKIEYFKGIEKKTHWSKPDTSRKGFLNLVANVLENKEIGALLDIYAKLTHTIGNFVLVPRGFNRGRTSKTSDYWDLSLQVIQSDKNWLQAETVKKYVNTFFLWDYVDENYEVRPFFAGHSLQNKKPNTISECVEMLQAIKDAIVRRGYFIVAMLKVAIKYPDKYEQIMNEIINLEKANMESAIQIIKVATNRDIEIFDILNKLQ
ncbi:hypothetical protein ABE096_08720 [Robertmurraya massiliosenegalensis]|uniref:hypothetical protein n=1 Tax=Robertmurraya TaxID=2837507 RepID=UPI0039A7815F